MLRVSTTNSAEVITEVIGIAEDERLRERVLREQFARFWASPAEDMRSTYDAFIGASPVVPHVDLQVVEEENVKGCWVCPKNASSNKAVLYIHGGGYVFGSSTAYRGFVSQIVHRTNVSTFVLDYPLAPEATLPAGPDAAIAAWHWLLSRGFKEIAIVGDSAGGGLSLVTLEELGKSSLGVTPVAAVVFSPWVDMTFSGGSMTDQTIEDPLIAYEYLKDCAQKYLGGFSASDPLASPLFGDLRGLPPLLIQVGTDERLFDDARQFADRAFRAGVRVKLEIWESMHHVFQLDVAHLKSSRDALDRAAGFLLANFSDC